MSKYEQLENNYIEENMHGDDILAEGETVLWEGKPKKSAFILNKILTQMPIALIWLAFDGFIIAMVAKADNLNSHMIMFLVVFFAFHLMPVWIWLSSILTAGKKWQNARYIVTDRRVITQNGFVGMDYNTAFYKEIKNVRLQIQVTDKLLGVGDVYIDTAGKKSLVFYDIVNPQYVYRKLQKTVMDIQTDIEYPNALRPESNPGYQSKYDGKF